MQLVAPGGSKRPNSRKQLSLSRNNRKIDTFSRSARTKPYSDSNHQSTKQTFQITANLQIATDDKLKALNGRGKKPGRESY